MRTPNLESMKQLQFNVGFSCRVFCSDGLIKLTQCCAHQYHVNAIQSCVIDCPAGPAGLLLKGAACRLLQYDSALLASKAEPTHQQRKQQQNAAKQQKYHVNQYMSCLQVLCKTCLPFGPPNLQHMRGGELHRVLREVGGQLCSYLVGDKLGTAPTLEQPLYACSQQQAKFCSHPYCWDDSWVFDVRQQAHTANAA